MADVQALLSETGEGVDTLADGAVGGLRRYEGRLGIDLDDVFSLTVPKTVKIRDARLGLCYYTFVLVALIFAFGNVILSRSYLVEHPHAVTVTMRPDISAAGGGRYDDHDLALDGNFFGVMPLPVRFHELEQTRDKKCLEDPVKRCEWVDSSKTSAESIVDDPLSFEVVLSLPDSSVTWYSNNSGTIEKLRDCSPPSDSNETAPEGACMYGNELKVQVQDAMEKAGWSFKTCQATVGYKGTGSDRQFAGSIVEGSCKPTPSLNHGKSDYHRSVMQPSFAAGLWFESQWNADADGWDHESVHNSSVTFACGANDPEQSDCIVPSYAGQAKIIFDITYDNKCPNSRWKCIMDHGLDFFLARLPPRVVVSYRAAGYKSGADSEGDVIAGYSSKAKYRYGPEANVRTVIFSEYITFITAVVGEVNVFTTSGLFTTLAGYSFVFAACLSAVKFAAVTFMRHKSRYNTLVTQTSIDFSVLEEFQKKQKQVDPESLGSALHDVILQEALKKSGGKAGPYLSDKDLLTVLIAMEQRLTALDAVGLHTKGQETFDKYIKAEENTRLARRVVVAK